MSVVAAQEGGVRLLWRVELVSSSEEPGRWKHVTLREVCHPLCPPPPRGSSFRRDWHITNMHSVEGRGYVEFLPPPQGGGQHCHGSCVSRLLSIRAPIGMLLLTLT